MQKQETRQRQRAEEAERVASQLRRDVRAAEAELKEVSSSAKQAHAAAAAAERTMLNQVCRMPWSISKGAYIQSNNACLPQPNKRTMLPLPLQRERCSIICAICLVRIRKVRLGVTILLKGVCHFQPSKRMLLLRPLQRG